MGGCRKASAETLLWLFQQLLPLFFHSESLLVTRPYFTLEFSTKKWLTSTVVRNGLAEQRLPSWEFPVTTETVKPAAADPELTRVLFQGKAVAEQNTGAGA